MIREVSSDNVVMSRRDAIEARLNIMRRVENVDRLDRDLKRERCKVTRCSNMPMIEIRFGNCTANALVDTGAQVTAMRRDLYARLRELATPMMVLPVKSFKLKGAFSERSALIAAKTRIAFRCNNHHYVHEFYLVDNLAFDVVLGLDFLTKYRVVIHFDETRMRVSFEDAINPAETIDSVRDRETKKRLNESLSRDAKTFHDETRCENVCKHHNDVKCVRPNGPLIYRNVSDKRDVRHNNVIEAESIVHNFNGPRYRR